MKFTSKIGDENFRVKVPSKRDVTFFTNKFIPDFMVEIDFVCQKITIPSA